MGRGLFLKIYLGAFAVAILFVLALALTGPGLTFINSHLGLQIMNPICRDYALPSADVYVRIYPNNSALIDETIHYTFKGCYHEVYREPEIPRSGTGPWLSEISASCEPECQTADRIYEIAGSFGTICDRDATFRVSMTVQNAMNKWGFHYKLWGSQWDKNLRRMHATIEAPTLEGHEIYLNPPIGTVTRNGNTITVDAENVNNALEVWIAAEGIATAQQKVYAVSYRLVNIFSIIGIIGFWLIAIIVPFLIYRVYGAEPNIAYDYPYEREPPALKPYMAHALIRTGNVSSDAIIATLLDLVRRKHATMAKKGTSVEFTFQQNAKDPLTPPEQKVYDFFSKHAEGGKLDWQMFEAKMETQKISGVFTFDWDFKKSVRDEFASTKRFSHMGSTIFRIFCIVMGALALALVMYAAKKNFAGLYPPIELFYFALPVIPIALISLFIPSRVFGQFTAEGLELYRKTMAYKNFMTDLTLLKKYPPASLVIWDEVLVYATALGVADEVSKNMSIIAPRERTGGRLYPAYGMSLHSGYAHAYAAAVAPRGGGGGFGGGGHVGGGFGGGGGGAR